MKFLRTPIPLMPMPTPTPRSTPAPGRRVRTMGIALAVAAVSLIGLSPAAHAAATTTVATTGTRTSAATVAPLAVVSPSAGTGTRTLVVHRPATGHDEAAAPDDTYTTCTIVVGSPYTAPGGTVDADGSISCTGTVYEIELEVALYYGTTQETGPVVLANYTNHLSDTTFAPHLTGYWQALAIARVYWTDPSTYTQAGPIESTFDLQ